MARTITTEAEKLKVQEYVRANHESMSDSDLAEVQGALKTYNLARAEAGAEPSAKPAVEPDLNFDGLLGKVEAGLKGLTSGFMSGLKDDFLAGTKQAIAQAQEQQGLPGAAEERAQIEQKRGMAKAQAEQQNKANLAKAGIDEKGFSAFDVGEIAGSASPEIAATFLTRRVPSGLARFFGDSMASAANAGAQFTEEDQSRLQNTLVGAAFGLPFAATGAVNTSARKIFTDPLTRPVLLSETEDLETIAKRMGLSGDAALTPAQATGSPSLLAEEKRLDLGAGGARRARLDAQSTQIQDEFKAKAAALAGNADVSVGTVADTLQSTVERRVGDLRKARGDNWKANMNAAQTAASAAAPGGRVLPFTNTYAKFAEILKDAADPLSGVKPENLSTLRARDAALTDELTKGNGRLSPERFQSLLVDLTDEGSGTGAIFSDLGTARARRVSQELRGAMMSDLEEAVKAGVPGAAEVKAARVGFAKDSAPIDNLRGTAVQALFGKAFGNPAVDEGTLGQKIMRLKPSDAKALMGAIDNVDPLVGDQMRSAVLTDLLELHRTYAGGAEPGDFNMKGFFNDLAVGPGKASTVETLFPKDKELTDGFRVLERVIFGQAKGTAGATVREAGSSATINPMQIAPAMGRQMLGIRSEEQLERLLFSPNALDQIRRLGKPGKVDLTGALAQDVTARLLQNYTNFDTEDKAKAERAKQAQQNAYLQNQVGASLQPGM